MKNKKYLFVVFTILILGLFSCQAEAKQKLKMFSETLFYDLPNPQIWRVTQQNTDKKRGAGVIMYQRAPVLNPQNVPIEPTMNIVFEKLPNDSRPDVIHYSMIKRSRAFFEVDEVFTYENGPLTYKNAIGYEGHFDQAGVEHKLLLAHMIYKGIGVQVICDSTADVYEQVVEDMRAFVKSVSFE